jgi:hypothetical protein
LWEAGTPQPDGSRTVIMGLGRLSKVARLSENNCRLNIRSLTLKLALEETGAENSRAGIGKTYRVFNYTTILERRRATGMEWVIRTKGVRFVNREGGEVASVSPTDSGGDAVSAGGAPTVSGGGAPTDSVPPYRNSLRNQHQEASSSDSPVLVNRLADLGIALDDDAARKIISRCQNSDAATTVEEVIYFAELKVRQLVKRKNIENWPGMLMAAIPVYFSPPATELARYRAEKIQESIKTRTLALEILEDSQSTPEDREWAQSTLTNLPNT